MPRTACNPVRTRGGSRSRIGQFVDDMSNRHNAAQCRAACGRPASVSSNSRDAPGAAGPVELACRRARSGPLSPVGRGLGDADQPLLPASARIHHRPDSAVRTHSAAAGPRGSSSTPFSGNERQLCREAPEFRLARVAAHENRIRGQLAAARISSAGPSAPALRRSSAVSARARFAFVPLALAAESPPPARRPRPSASPAGHTAATARSNRACMVVRDQPPPGRANGPRVRRRP